MPQTLQNKSVRKSSGQRPAASMADLMKSVKTPLISLKKGEIVQGIVTKLSSSEILLDIGSKTEAVVMEKDRANLRNLLSVLKVGDKVSAVILNPESDMGHTVVSLRRFMSNGVWDQLEKLQKSQLPLTVTFNDVTRGGFLVSTREGLSGFLPNSHVSHLDESQHIVGKTIKVVVLELNRAMGKVIFSQKAVTSSADFEKTVNALKIGQEVLVTVTNVAAFGIFTLLLVSESSVEGFVHISEVAWEKTEDLQNKFRAGEKIAAKIIGFDKDAKRVSLSIKQLTDDPFAKKFGQYTMDKKVTGIIAKIMFSGIVVDIENERGEAEAGVEGFIKKDKIPPTVTYTVGNRIIATVAGVEPKKHRVLLVPVLKEKPIGYR